MKTKAKTRAKRVSKKAAAPKLPKPKRQSLRLEPTEVQAVEELKKYLNKRTESSAIMHAVINYKPMREMLISTVDEYNKLLVLAQQKSDLEETIERSKKKIAEMPAVFKGFSFKAPDGSDAHHKPPHMMRGKELDDYDMDDDDQY